MSAPFTTKEVMLNAQTTPDATNDGADGYVLTSSGYQVGDRSELSIQVISVGSTPTCYIDVSQDGINWTPYFRIIDNATGSPLTVGSVQVPAIVGIHSGAMLMFPRGDLFDYIRIRSLFSTPMNASTDEDTAPYVTATLHALY